MKEYQSLMTQRELCNRWQVCEAKLERWRSEGTGEKMYWSMRSVA